MIVEVKPDAYVGGVDGEALLFYDGECQLCLRAVRLIRAWDRRQRIASLPYQSKLAARLLPDLRRSDLARAMLLLDPGGRRHRGADAVPHILSLLPGGLLLRLLFKLPGIPALARKLYRLLAANRRSLGCALPPASAVQPG